MFGKFSSENSSRWSRKLLRHRLLQPISHFLANREKPNPICRGHVKLYVNFNKEVTWKTHKVQFLMFDCKSIDNCIIEIPMLVDMSVVSSTPYFKMKYHFSPTKVEVIYGDIEITCRCLFIALKNYKDVIKIQRDDQANE